MEELVTGDELNDDSTPEELCNDTVNEDEIEESQKILVTLIRRRPFLTDRMPTIGAFSIRSCFNGCRDRSPTLGLSTIVWNLTDKPVELQVRVGSTLKKGHTLKPGSSKRLKCRNIWKEQMPKKSSCGINEGRREMKSLIYYYDETCHPYVWIHDGMSDFSRVVKQQYISLEDLRDCSEIKIFRDHQRGCVAVRKKPRPDLC